MKPTFIALLALCLCLAGCGKKELKQTAKESPKTKEAPEKSQPKPPQIKPGTVLWEFETKKTGTLLWKFETGGRVVSSPAIGPDGTVYVGSNDKSLYAIKTDSKARGPCVDRMRGTRVGCRNDGRDSFCFVQFPLTTETQGT